MPRKDQPKYFEDFVVGETYEHGSHTVTREEIVAFGERYDPQPFHVDEEAAAESVFGGLVASGWHTVAVCQGMLIRGRPDVASMGGRGVDELRWHRPVRPGDTLSVTTEVVDKRRSESVTDRGYVDMRVTGLEGDGDPVVSWTVLGMIGRRDSG